MDFVFLKIRGTQYPDILHVISCKCLTMANWYVVISHRYSHIETYVVVDGCSEARKIAIVQ